MESTAPYLAATLRGRQQSHRRRGILVIGALLVLGTSPVVGYHLVTRASGMTDMVSTEVMAARLSRVRVARQ